MVELSVVGVESLGILLYFVSILVLLVVGEIQLVYRIRSIVRH